MKLAHWSRASLMALALAVPVIGFGLAAHPARADDNSLVVLNATDPSLHPGDHVSPTAPFTVAAGQSVTLISVDGSVITLKGPFTGLPTATTTTQTASVADMLTPLLQKASTENATPGVIRDGKLVAGPSTDPWVIDASRSGDVCIHEDVEYDIWRADPTKDETVTLAPVSGGQPVSFSFPANAQRSPVPDTFTFTDGAQYKISGPSETSTITIHTVPHGVPTNKISAAWFAKQNCTEQATALAKYLVN